jgi:predicted transcriptional regulator
MTTNAKILRIGIASREQMKARTLAIARGELRPGANDPKVWFTSLESLAQVLSSKNKLLLEIIRLMRPASLKQLAEFSGRKEGNLSRTLHTMARYRLVTLDRSERGTIVPSVPYDRVLCDFELNAAQAAVPISLQARQNELRRQNA